MPTNAAPSQALRAALAGDRCNWTQEVPLRYRPARL